MKSFLTRNTRQSRYYFPLQSSLLQIPYRTILSTGRDTGGHNTSQKPSTTKAMTFSDVSSLNSGDFSSPSRPNTGLTRASTAKTAASSVYHYPYNDNVNLSRASCGQAFKRCFLPGWVETSSNGGNGWTLGRVFRNFFAVLLGFLTPIIILLPLVQLPFKVNSDKNASFTVSLLQTWWSGSGNEG